MFDLEQAICEWRAGFNNPNALTQDDLSELDSHLRESISAIRTRGLSDEEAFVVATMRLGRPASLNVEFAKIHGPRVWHERVLWLVAGYVGGTSVGCAVSGIRQFVLTVCAVQFNGATAATIATVFAASCWFVLMLTLVGVTRRNDQEVVNLASWRWIAYCLAMLAIGRGLSVVGGVLLVTQVPMEEIAIAAIWTSWGQLAVQTIVFLSCIAMIYRLHRRTIRVHAVT